MRSIPAGAGSLQETSWARPSEGRLALELREPQAPRRSASVRLAAGRRLADRFIVDDCSNE